MTAPTADKVREALERQLAQVADALAAVQEGRTAVLALVRDLDKARERYSDAADKLAQAWHDAHPDVDVSEIEDGKHPLIAFLEDVVHGDGGLAPVDDMLGLFHRASLDDAGATALRRDLAAARKRLESL